MQSIQRDLSVGFCLCALVFTCVLIWGDPFVAASGAKSARAQDRQPVPAQAPQDQSQQQTKSSTFTGTILKDGSQYSLRDSSGQVYKLDDPESAKAYEGKQVKIVGELDQQARLIHVQSIEGTAS